MKISCYVIEDLLPLYYDGVCSEESNILVEEHLKECKNCRNLLLRIQSETTETNSFIDDATPLKSIRDKWIKSKKNAFFKGTIITLAFCILIIGGYVALTQWKCIPVSPELIDVTQVSQLGDGRIIYHLNIKDDKELRFIKFTTNKDGSYYITPMRSVIEKKRIMESGLFNEYCIIDIEENNAYEQNYGDGIIINSCYIGPKDNGILIWKNGMELPKASEDLEQMTLKGVFK